MRYIVVEPHSDDAFLSLGWHLEKLWAGEERIIVTVYADERRADEARAYASAIGASSVVLGLAESRMDSSGPVRRIDALGEALDALNVGEEDRAVFPLGLQHPDHKRVAASRTAGSLRYLDTPYQTKQKLASDLQGRAQGLGIASLCFPPKVKWKHAGVFKSQAKFFYYNGELVTRGLPEIVLC